MLSETNDNGCFDRSADQIQYLFKMIKIKRAKQQLRCVCLYVRCTCVCM